METIVETNVEKTKIDVSVPNRYLKRIIIGLTEIGGLEIGDFKINYNIAKTLNKLNEAEKVYIKTITDLQKKYIKKDVNGKPMIIEGKFVFNSNDDREKYYNELDKLNDSDSEIEIRKIKISDLQNVNGIKGTSLASCFEVLIDDIL